MWVDYIVISLEQDKPFFLNGAEDSSCDSPAYTLLNDKT